MAVNDDVRNALESYGGFSINTRVYNYLGSLGYTGTISDRLAKYSYEDKKGWQALIARYAGTGWTPAALFAQGQQGVWYEPEPVYLYEDSAGTIEDVVNNDPVGLMLDRSKGLELGPEEVTNGTFDSDITGWSAYTVSATVTDGIVYLSGGGANQRDALSQEVALTAGRMYRVSVDVPPGSDGGVYISTSGGSSAALDRITPTMFGSGETITFTFTAAATNYIVLGGYSELSNPAYDNASVKELPGNHATQPTSADRPLYGTDGSLHRLGFDGAGDNLRTADFGLPHLHSVSVAFYPTEQGDFVLDGSTTNSSSLWVSNQSGLEGQIRAFAGTSLYTSNTVTYNAWNIVTAVFDGTNSIVRLNGVEVVGDVGTAAPGGVTLGWDGGRTNTSTSLKGRIAAAVAREGRFSSGQIQDIERYLNGLVGGGVI